MKTSLMTAALLIAFGLASCIQDADVSPQNNSSSNPAIVNEGSWIITYFWDSDKDETYHFNGFVFDFQDNGILKAANGNSTFSGTWTFGTDDSHHKLYINFSGPSEFEELSDDWHILESSDNKIQLEDVSGGNGGTDYLTFEKI